MTRELDAMEQALAELDGMTVSTRRRAIWLLETLHAAGWELERTAAGMTADTVSACLQLAAEAEADGDHDFAIAFRADARRAQTQAQHKEAA